MFRVLNSFSFVVSVYVSVSWSSITSGNYFSLWDIQEMVDRGNLRCDPIAGAFVVFDLVPVMVFEVKLNGKTHAFKKYEVSDVITDFEPHGVLQVSSGNVAIPSSSDRHSGLEVFARCHDWEVRPNVATG